MFNYTTHRYYNNTESLQRVKLVPGVMFLSSKPTTMETLLKVSRGSKQQEVEGVHLSHMPSSNKEFYDKTPIEKNVHTRQEDEDYEREMREAVKFIPSDAFAGAKPGYEFRTGPNGLGYYLTTYKEEKGYSYELHFDEASQRPYVLLFELFKISVETHTHTLETQVLVQ